MTQLVTGDAVALDLPAAKLPSRALAAAIDAALVFGVYLAVSLVVVASTSSLDDAARSAVSVAMFLLVLVGGPIAVETLSRGRSLGKLALGLRVVRDDGGPIRFRHALVRGAIATVEILLTLGVVACLASLVSARGRRLGDVFAGTLVVRERVPVARVGVLPPPPPRLTGRFSEVDLSAVPDGLWLAVRQYLSRMHQLDTEVSRSMADGLASDLVARTMAPVPPEMPSSTYLAVMLHERQSREARKLVTGGPSDDSSGSRSASAVQAADGFPSAAPPFAPSTAFSPGPASSPCEPGSGPASGSACGSGSGSASGSDGSGLRASGRATGFVPPA